MIINVKTSHNIVFKKNGIKNHNYYKYTIQFE